MLDGKHVGFLGPFRDTRPGLLGLHPPAGGSAHPFAQRWILHEGLDCTGQRGGVSFRDDRRGLAIDSHGADAARQGRHHRRR